MESWFSPVDILSYDHVNYEREVIYKIQFSPFLAARPSALSPYFVKRLVFAPALNRWRTQSMLFSSAAKFNATALSLSVRSTLAPEIKHHLNLSAQKLINKTVSNLKDPFSCWTAVLIKLDDCGAPVAPVYLKLKTSRWHPSI